jgi:hypothetical protein
VGAGRAYEDGGENVEIKKKEKDQAKNPRMLLVMLLLL